jgi:hypothetical protein
VIRCELTPHAAPCGDCMPLPDSLLELLQYPSEGEPCNQSAPAPEAAGTSQTTVGSSSPLFRPPLPLAPEALVRQREHEQKHNQGQKREPERRNQLWPVLTAATIHSPLISEDMRAAIASEPIPDRSPATARVSIGSRGRLGRRQSML